MKKRTSKILKNIKLEPLQSSTPLITEENLINLGFKKNNVSTEESGDYAYYYFTYDTKQYKTLFISNASDKFEKEGICIEFFDMPELGKFTHAIQINHLITLIKTMQK